MLEAALEYAKRGWPVFPCVPGNKNPATRNGFHDASTDTEQIQAWWRKEPDANIGVATGIVSGLVVVDIDISGEKPGVDSLMEIKPGGWETLTSTTWSGGWHYFFEHPKSLPISSRKGAMPGIDIRADGGYVVAPPSVVAGKTYRWNNESELSALDEAALELMRFRAIVDTEPTTESGPITLPQSRIDRVGRALDYIDPEPYDDWYKTGMALYEMGGGSDQLFQVWDSWSAEAKNYDHKIMRAKWRSFGSTRGDKITEASLWKRATEGGFYEKSDLTADLLRQAPEELRPPNISEFMDLEFPTDDPILGPINTNQIINLIGPTGLGKSNLTLNILNAMARKVGVFGWTAHRRVPILYIDGEMGGMQLQSRLKHYRWGDADFRVVNAINWCAKNKLGQPNLSEVPWQEMILKWAPPGGVVALDNLMSLVHVPNTSLSSDEFWRVVTPLNLGLRAMGCTVIWVDHTNAEGKIFGTKTKEWQSDLVLTLSTNERTDDFEDQPGTAFTMSFTKVRGEKSSVHAALDIEMTPDQYAGFEWKYTLRKTSEIDIAHELKMQGLTQRAIAKEMNMSASKVNKLLKIKSDPLSFRGNSA